MQIGTIVHAVAHAVPDGDRERMHEELAVRLDELGLGDGWVARRARERAEAMIDKLADYVATARKQGRELVGTEVEARARVGRADIRGVVDRLERDRQGRLWVVDLKTGRTPPPKADLPRHPQLGTYQVIAEEGGFADVPPAESGGAALVQLGTPTKRVGVMPQEPLSADSDPQWAHTMVEQVAEGMSGEQFPATSNGMCRFCPVRRSCPLQSEGRTVGS
jgi:RecB family exonuclease